MAGDADGQWYLGIGDPTLRGWLTVGAYFLAACIALRAASVTSRLDGPLMPSLNRRRLVGFWCITAVTLVLLGINKQLDLQSWFTQVMRDLSKEQGWYEARRHYQFAFVVALGTVGLLSSVTAVLVLWRVLHQIGIALLGFAILVTFVVMRASSFYHINMLLDSGPLAPNWWAEFSGVALITLNAWAAARSRPCQRHGPRSLSAGT